MIRQDFNRVDPKRRMVTDHRKKQFAEPTQQDEAYPFRLNFYSTPPTADITIEQFEQWAINRLRILAELEACSFRNKTPTETADHMRPLLVKYLPLDSNSSRSDRLFAERQRDHYSHFILRLAFAKTEDLRRRFARVETMLFRMRFAADDSRERAAFVRGLSLDWESVTEAERTDLAAELAAVSGTGARKGQAQSGAGEEESWMKVDWTRVPELVEQRKVYVRAGKAYVPAKEQAALVISAFTKKLEAALEKTSQLLPELDEEDRLQPILNHLAKNFITPDAAYRSDSGAPDGAEINARNVDHLATHFPLCMQHLHRSLRRDAHLKHYGRLQYTLFLKGIGLSLEECLAFWRTAFSRKTTDTEFDTKYRYNVRHVYGDVGGDSNRRGGGYSPFSCQKILLENAPGPEENHGCPYRHFDVDNLTALLQGVGVTDRSVLQGVRDDKASDKFHLACNRVFEHAHKEELRRAREQSIMTAAQLETIVHPNEYFKRSYILKHLEDVSGGGGPVGGGGGASTSRDIKMDG